MSKKTDQPKNTNQVNFHSPHKKTVKADIVSKNNENNYNLEIEGKLITNVIRKENHNFNQLNNLNYFTELSE